MSGEPPSEKVKVWASAEATAIKPRKADRVIIPIYFGCVSGIFRYGGLVR